jgi:hypothetical protein
MGAPMPAAPAPTAPLTEATPVAWYANTPSILRKQSTTWGCPGVYDWVSGKDSGRAYV